MNAVVVLVMQWRQKAEIRDFFREDVREIVDGAGSGRKVGSGGQERADGR